MMRTRLFLLTLGTSLIASPALFGAGDAEKGKEAFGQCAMCHNVDKPDKKMGPSLMGLYKKDKMANGKAVSDENVMAVINEGGSGMPAYKDILSDEERADVLAYLKTL